jgi:RNA polymerase sigma factor (sigma-70 family)
MPGPQPSDALIAVVDDEPRVRKGLERLIRSMGWRVRTFASAHEFLERVATDAPCCLVLDLQMPGLSGLDLQKRMGEMGLETPIIFLTGHGDIPATVEAMKAGASEFLTKPVGDNRLLAAIEEAIERDRRAREQRADRDALQHLYDSLTAREQEVMQHVIAGLLNKQIAAELNITEDTVKFHRGHIMRKMRADSLAGLVRMAENLGIRPQRRPV